MEAVNTCHTSVGCNRTPHCADWGRNNIICYGACRSVAICHPEGSEPAAILHTLTGHKEKVNCVSWIRQHGHDAETELVSGSVDKTAIVWKQQEKKKFTVAQVLTGHTGPVTAVNALRLDTRTVILTASVDSSVKVWYREAEGDFINTQTLTYGSGFCLDVSLICLPGTDILLLACGCDDQRVHLYAEDRQSKESKFVSVIMLHGHEDWVRAVDFTLDDSGDILLASAAQDYMIRIWRLSSRETDTGKQVNSIQDLPLDKDIQMKENTFCFKYQDKDKVYAVSLESVLSGHENWIYSVKWKPWTSLDINAQSGHQEMCLLSVSMDKTMLLWQPDQESGVWVEQARMGEVGGNTLGLYGGVFSPDGNSVIAHGYQGAFHHWAFNKLSSSWKHMVTVGGHFDSVEDIDWDRGNCNFLLSTSLDETVRLHAPWVTDNRQVRWYEIARPQVHGYALQCLTMIHQYRYASGADEKVVRVFDATNNFIENFCKLCGISSKEEKREEEVKSRPQGATVPALGLSNKAIFPDGPPDLTEDLEVKPGTSEQYSDNVFTPVTLQAPPTEEHLLQNSLWPEVQKLYGHGYEIFSLACDPKGKVLASSCKASKTEFASVILWDTVTWQQLCTLEGHNLTVTQMTFSHNGQYLLTVSRDRTWCVYRKKSSDQPESDPLFSMAASVDKKTCVHARIIWSCAWSHDDRYFVTASRDKKVICWPCPSETKAGGDTGITPVAKLDVGDSATAVDMAPVPVSNNSYLVTIGLEKGHILLYKWTPDSPSPWQQIASLDSLHAHHLTVKRLKFRPCPGLAGIHGDDLKKQPEVKDRNDWLQLASCGADHAVKLFNIYLPKLQAS